MAITVEPLSPALGAAIGGVDLRRPVDDATFAQILAAWHAHLVIVFRDQKLDEDSHIAFASRFGELWTVPEGVRSRAQTNRPDRCMMVTNVRDDVGKAVGSLPDGEMVFHVDNIYTERPAKATTLYGIDVPSRGGDTRFLNLYKAYEAMPERIKRALDGRRAVHFYTYGETGFGNQGYKDAGGNSHPAVIVHPDTGRKALYMCRLMTRRIEGMDPAESDALLAEIFDRMEQPEFIYDHKWRKGDLVIWDNRCVLHGRSDFDPAERRLMRRVTTNMDLRPAG